MKKIAVTGGAGFIGSNLVERFLSHGHEVTVVDDLSTGLKSNLDLTKVTFHELCITDRDGLAKAVKGVDAIVHLGARGSVPRSIKNPIATHDVNATGTLNVLEAARGNGAHVIFSSSSSVYGRNGQKCVRCGDVIRLTKMGTHARLLYWCPGCQVGCEPYPERDDSDPIARMMDAHPAGSQFISDILRHRPAS